MTLPENFKLDPKDAKYEGSVLHSQKLGAIEVGVKEAPVFLHIDSDTDWATAVPAAAGVVVALVVAWMTIGVQKNQIQGNIANFRHHWMSDLRETGAELTQLLVYMANVNTQIKGYNPSQEYIDKCARASQLRAKIDLLLSREDKTSVELRNATKLAVDTVTGLKFGHSKEAALNNARALQTLLRQELERAWADMKSDLGVNKRFLFVRLFKNKSNI
ncbi:MULTISPECIES: hypothetical protein [Pseudomonas]|uniref:Uncharacterized protein n=1 Tax=Pseudomonas mosselii TaxID=78327 RepID=A0A5R8ZI15_9PSED|nr:hypothetical protein [Pseudomonas mosselii]TLP65005.1 hypothetical protein FEM01_02160 [Pseudomonas mosselii]